MSDDSTIWSLKFAVEIFLSLIIIIALLSIFVNFFNKKQPKDPEIIDLERFVSEIRDLNENEEINIPLFSKDYNIFIVSSKKINSLGLSCKIDSDYCACVKKEDSIIGCRYIIKKAEIKDSEIKIDKYYLKIKYYNDYISFN